MDVASLPFGSGADALVSKRRGKPSNCARFATVLLTGLDPLGTSVRQMGPLAAMPDG